MRNFESNIYDVCILGGGAAGLAAAVRIKQKNIRKKICIIDRNDRLGRKIYASGNGKCNLTNVNAERANVVLDFFASLGLAVKTMDEGRVYPASEQAEDVVFVMESFLKRCYGVDVFLNTDIDIAGVHKEGNFHAGDIEAENLLIAMGGKAAPVFGTKGDSYLLARHLGHSVNKVYPILAGIRSSVIVPGVRAKGIVTLMRKGKPVSCESGEIQFTADGISGICVMNTTRSIVLDDSTKISDYSYHIDFMPSMKEKDLTEMILERMGNDIDPIRSIVPKALCEYIKSRCSKEAGEYAHMIKKFPADVLGVKGWQDAQCTAGGVPISEIDTLTMESEKVRGLYFAGEVIDYDGPCGGYNLNNAFLSGICAGDALAKGEQDAR